MLFRCRRQDGAHCLGRLIRVADHSTAFLDDARLLPRNFRDGLSQQGGMVQADASDGRHQRIGHHIGGIVASAKAGLQHHKVTIFLGKPQKRHRSDCFKLDRRRTACSLYGVGGIQHPLSQVGQGLRRDHSAVDLEAFPEIGDIGADGQTRLIACLGQDIRRHDGKGPFPVGPRNMDTFQRALRVAQGFHQGTHPVQRGLAAAGDRMQRFNRLLWRHMASSSSSGSSSVSQFASGVSVLSRDTVRRIWASRLRRRLSRSARRRRFSRLMA